MKNLLLIYSCILLASCSNFSKVPKCDDDEVKQTILYLLYGEITDERLNPHIKSSETIKQLADLLPKTRLTSIITLSKDNELKSCKCQAIVEMPNEILENDKLTWEIEFKQSLYPSLVSHRLVGNGETIYYDLKTDSEGEILVEVYQD